MADEIITSIVREVVLRADVKEPTTGLGMDTNEGFKARRTDPLQLVDCCNVASADMQTV